MIDIKPDLIKKARMVGVKLTDEQAQKLERYLELMLEWNEKINLTAITDPSEAVEKHFADSLSLLSACKIKPGASLIDVGTGAGLPGLPLKIVRPDIKLTLLDGLNKRLVFLNAVCKELDIEAETMHKRAEEAGLVKAMRESYDVAVARAVAPLNILSEYCLPLVKMKGLFIAMKGPSGEDELNEAGAAIEKLGGGKVQSVGLTLPTSGERTIICVQKLRYTPKAYPRHGGTITKHPL